MNRSSFVSNERDIRRISSCLCFSVKWRLVLVLGKLEQQRGSTICFRRVSRFVVENDQSLDETTEHAAVNNDTRACFFFLCFTSPVFSPCPMVGNGPC